MFQTNPLKRVTPFILLLLFGMILALPARAADVLPGWGSWWLPPNRSAHGGDIDWLFNLIFWITMVTFVVVEIVLLVFCIKYRSRPDRKKAHFTHGNTRLEMAWTLAPAVILAVLALLSKKVWDNYRYSPTSEDPNRAKLLVIGQQFKWNIVYPGKDGKFGRYLLWPKPTDALWPPGPDGKPVMHAGVKGPADLGYEKARGAIATYIDTVNPLGKDFTDPDGKDDDYQGALAREISLPVNRPIEVQLSSKDVIHDFFLPNFRVKLDAVPGMRGHLYFTAMMTSKQREESSRKEYAIDELIAALKDRQNKELTISIARDAPGASYDTRAHQTLYKDKKNATIVRDQRTITPDVAQKLKDAGVTKVTAYLPGYWDLVCEELCGQGHYTMQGKVVVLDQAEYDKKGYDKPSTSGATTQPSSIALGAAQ
ncbi:MAG TPA: cytochrome c oxidase subunit II [Tepidisphaeraceae bacterium]|nr:cytochrome c oxidase subunit II [Tepidisphaeraceae bacterium]